MVVGSFMWGNVSGYNGWGMGSGKDRRKAAGKVKRPDLSKEVNGRCSSPPQNCLQGEE